MKTTCIFDKDGTLINIGPWDYCYEPSNDGAIVAKNPLPEGSYEEERDIVMDADGGRMVAAL
jgi:hypothetical protein